MLRRKEVSIGKIQQKKKGNERHVGRKEQNYRKQRPYHSVKKQLDCVNERFKESEEDDETTCVVLDECK